MRHFAIVGSLALFAWVVPASATLLTISETIGLLAQPPASLLPGHLYSNQFIFLFLEQQHVTLTAPLAVDITAPGTYTLRSQLVPGTIAAGTVVNSYYLHADPINQKFQELNQVISWSTDELVIGVMLNPTTLASGVPAVGIATTAYNGPTGQNGFKLAMAGKDTIEISADQHTITFSEQSKPTVLTEFRVITMTVPLN